MALLRRSQRLKKQLGLLDVYVMATGTTLGAGFFMLPGLAAAQIGPGMFAAYLLAVVPLIPAVLAKVELATAMPRAGGTYYFLDRSLGPLVGTIGGIGTWFALLLKTSFALIALGAYVTLFFPELPMKPLTVAIAVGLAALNLLGSRAAGTFQIGVVGVLLVMLAGFLFGSLPSVELSRLDGAFSAGVGPTLATAGLVYVAYVGLSKVISLAEEVRAPERNLPLGIFLAIGTTVAIYALGTFVMLGVLGAERLAGDLTPVATTARDVFGLPGAIVMSLAAVLASISVANAGVISSSRYPMAMGRDHLVPRALMQLDARGVPRRALALSVALIVAALLLLDPLGIAKLAGSFQLLVFSLMNVAVIVMRESHLASYDPGYRSPGYPWMHLVGIVAPLVLIASMGALPILFSLGMIVAGALWFRLYAAKRVHRRGALLHVFSRLGKHRFEGLEIELRSLLKEKGPRRGDRFDEVVARAGVIDMPSGASFEQAVKLAAAELSSRLRHPEAALERGFLDGTRVGATPVEHGVAIPHLRVRGIVSPELVVVRSLDGLTLGELAPEAETGNESLHALFFLVSPEGDASQHLRFLAHLAVRVEESGFMLDWTMARDESTLRKLLLQNELHISLVLSSGSSTSEWIDRTLREIALPDACLVAAVHRGGITLVPDGDTRFEAGDEVTLIGTAKTIEAIRTTYAS